MKPVYHPMGMVKGEPQLMVDGGGGLQWVLRIGWVIDWLVMGWS